MKKTAKRIINSVIITVVIAFIVTVIITGNTAFKSSMQLVNNENTSGQRNSDVIADYCVENLVIESSMQDHTIPASLLSVDGVNDRNTIIMVHGLQGNRTSTYRQAVEFLKMGYNVLAYDQRSSGANTAQYTTYGFWESRDLVDYVKYVDGIISPEREIILWGCSFGGATVSISLDDSFVLQRISAAILDSPMGDMRDILRENISKSNISLPTGFILACGNMTTKLKLGFSYNDASPTSHVSKSDVPLLVISTTIDTVTPFYMSKGIYEASQAKIKHLFQVDDSAHARIYFDHPEEYVANVKAFLAEVEEGEEV